MTSRDFCYWLQGFFELNQAQGLPTLTPQQAELVRRHLALVFRHEIDPSFPKEQQTELNEIHNQPACGIFDQPSLVEQADGYEAMLSDQLYRC